MKYTLSAFAVLLLCGAQGKAKPVWMKYEQACVTSVQTGKPVLTYVVGSDRNVDARDLDDMLKGTNLGRFAGLPGNFYSNIDSKTAEKFILAKIANPKRQKQMDARNNEVIIQDPDGEILHRAVVDSAGALEATAEEGLKKFPSKPIQWQAYTGSLESFKESKKLVILAFTQDNKENEAVLKAIEERWISKVHDKCIFLQAAYEKDSPEVKKWGVNGSATLVLIDPSREEGSKAVMERIQGKTTVVRLKRLIDKSLKLIRKDP